MQVTHPACYSSIVLLCDPGAYAAIVALLKFQEELFKKDSLYHKQEFTEALKTSMLAVDKAVLSRE